MSRNATTFSLQHFLIVWLDHISKHPRREFKYDALRSIFDELQGVENSVKKKTVSSDISSQSKGENGELKSQNSMLIEIQSLLDLLYDNEFEKIDLHSVTPPLYASILKSKRRSLKDGKTLAQQNN